MTVDRIAVVCKGSKKHAHARGKVADIETFELDSNRLDFNRWAPTRVERVAGYLFQPNPKYTAQPSYGNSQGDYDGIEQYADQLHYQCKLCPLDLDVTKAKLFPALDTLARAGVSEVSFIGLIQVLSNST